ncbi:MAG: DNA-3-methyladenine glycosylase I [Sporolactobacillus sp.]
MANLSGAQGDGRERCAWPTSDPLYLAYHDQEWGRPLHDPQKLFELLCLEGMQAGLSWITVLKRRENYRRDFNGFDPREIADFTPEKVNELMEDRGIIRNRRKIEAIINNARCLLVIAEERSFSDYLWSFTGGRTIQHHYTELSEIPASTEESRKMSKDLKKRGFKFVGETICYAFMQSAGMVNDHQTRCFCYQQIASGVRRIQ